MNAKNWKQLEKLATRCAEALRDPSQQSAYIFRGDMWAIFGACHEIRKAREKKAGPSPRAAEGAHST